MKKLLIIIVTALLILPVLAGCGGGTPSDTTEPPVSVDVTTAEPEKDYLEDIDMEGFEFIVNVRGKNTGNNSFPCKDFLAVEDETTKINEAVFRRNEKITANHNCKLTAIESAANQYEQIRAYSTSGDPLEGAIVLGTQAATLAQNGLLLDVSELPYVDLSAEWWDQNAVEAFTIAGNIYLVTGDNNISTMDATRITVFNNSMVQNYGLESPYELVRQGKWTIDKMMEMSMQVNEDLDTNGVLNAKDRVGYYNYIWSSQFLFYGSGERITSTSSDGYPEITVFNERSSAVFDRIFAICASAGKETITGVWAEQKPMFYTGNAMFTHLGISAIRKYLSFACEESYGIVPIAKYEEAQERYYNIVPFQDWTHLWCIPTTASDDEKVGFMLEALAYYSKDTVRVAYYEETLAGRALRDDESVEMLDIVFNSRVYDLASIYDWGGLNNYLIAVRSLAVNNFASYYETIKPMAERALATTIDSYKNIQDW